MLGQLGANILEVSHRRMFLDVPAKGAELEIMIETRDERHAEEIVATDRSSRDSSRACPRCAGRAGDPQQDRDVALTVRRVLATLRPEQHP